MVSILVFLAFFVQADRQRMNRRWLIGAKVEASSRDQKKNSCQYWPQGNAFLSGKRQQITSRSDVYGRIAQDQLEIGCHLVGGLVSLLGRFAQCFLQH